MSATASPIKATIRHKKTFRAMASLRKIILPCYSTQELKILLYGLEANDPQLKPGCFFKADENGRVEHACAAIYPIWHKDKCPAHMLESRQNVLMARLYVRGERVRTKYKRFSKLILSDFVEWFDRNPRDKTFPLIAQAVRKALASRKDNDAAA